MFMLHVQFEGLFLINSGMQAAGDGCYGDKGKESCQSLLWVELSPSKRYVQVLTA